MEHNKKIPQKPSSPTSEHPENQPEYVNRRSVHQENHPQNPLIARSPYQEIDSAFSRLSLAQNIPPPRTITPPILGIPANLYPTAPVYGEEQQTPFWVQAAQGNNGGTNGLFGPHQNINVGPGQIGGFNVGGPYLDPSLSMARYQDFYDASAAANNYYDYCSFLHGKKNISKELNNGDNYIPVVPSVYSQLQQQQTIQKLIILNMKLDKGLSLGEIEVILSDVIDVLGELVKNQIGSHIFVKLFLVCNGDQRTRIISALVKFPYRFISICLNSNGSVAMQKVLEKVIDPQQIWLLVSSFGPGSVVLASDPNGQHIIQYCVKQFPGEYTKHIVNAIADNCYKVGTDKSGCCVIQSCVEYHRGAARDRLISEIIANAVPLAEDPYGNYVVQHLIGTRRPELTADLLRRFLGCFASLSCNKYASNVVEKFLTESGENHSAQIIIELLKSPKASMLLMDPYGNFVIQSALLAAKGHVRDALHNLIRVNAVSMQSNLYGRKVLACLERGSSVMRRRA